MILRKIIEIDESKCNGCGQCIVDCHENAIAIVNGVAKVIKDSLCDGMGDCIGACPTGALKIVERMAEPFDLPTTTIGRADPAPTSGKGPGHWPLKLNLISSDAAFLKDADVILAADCVAFHEPSFHAKYADGLPLMIICPKFSDYGQIVEKLKAIFSRSGMKSCRIVRMEVPCCSALVSAAKAANTEANIPLHEEIVKIFG